MNRRAFLTLPVAAMARGAEQPVFPGKQWEKAGDAGYLPARLKALTPFLETIDTSGMIVISRGKVVYEYGDLTRLSYIASCRKSVLAMLYGNYVASGAIKLDLTLRDLKMDDIGGLMPAELDARIIDLITARSGVYHDASNPGDASGSAPKRGSKKPGTYYLYNNWDFNAAGAIFEKLTGKNIYDALESDIARPIGMEDFDRKAQKKSGDLKRSIYPAYHMYFSTRDMARIGYLMLHEGNWNGKQLIPRDWARKIVALETPVDQFHPQSWKGFAKGELWGYGYMWWVWDGHGAKGPFAGAFTARGHFGQYITVLPAIDTVVAHKTVPGKVNGGDRQVTMGQYQAALMHIVASRKA